jgi:hypothetical protein
VSLLVRLYVSFLNVQIIYSLFPTYHVRFASNNCLKLEKCTLKLTGRNVHNCKVECLKNSSSKSFLLTFSLWYNYIITMIFSIAYQFSPYQCKADPQLFLFFSPSSTSEILCHKVNYYINPSSLVNLYFYCKKSVFKTTHPGYDQPLFQKRTKILKMLYFHRRMTILLYIFIDKLNSTSYQMNKGLGKFFFNYKKSNRIAYT